MAKKDKTQTDDTLNGAPSDQALHEEMEQQAATLDDTLDDVKEELDEALSSLRYEVAKLRLEEARIRAKSWVEDNPTLTLALAIGAGVVVGRLLGEVLRPAPPPPPAWRSLGRRLTSQARHLGDHLAEQAAVRSRDLIQAAGTVSQRAREFGDDIAQRAEELADLASEQTSDLRQTLSSRADRTASALNSRVYEQVHRAEPLLNAAKTATTALVLKKVTDWIRRVL